MALNNALRFEGSRLLRPFRGGRRDRSSVGLYQHLVTMNGLASALAAARDLGELQQCLTSAYAGWMPGETVRLYLNEADAHPRDESLGCLGPAAEAMESGIPVLIDDALQAADLMPEENLASPARSLIALPLCVSNRVLGCLEIASMQPRRFTPLDYHLSLLVASHLASTLENIVTKQQLTETNNRLLDQERRLEELHQRMLELVHTDDLTGLFNRRRLMVQLDNEIARARRYGGELSCLMIDIDGFKQVNDSCGHQAGDLVLRQLGDLFRRCSRATDFVARYGGDEFTVVLPHTGARGAVCAAEKLRCKVMEHLFGVEAERRLSLTISIGAVSCTDQLDAAEFICRADRALYRAKRSGGNLVVDNDSPPDEKSRICQGEGLGLTHYALSD